MKKEVKRGSLGTLAIKALIASLILAIFIGSQACQKARLRIQTLNSSNSSDNSAPVSLDRSFDFTYQQDPEIPYSVQFEFTKIPDGLDKIHIFPEGKVGANTFYLLDRERLPSGWHYDYGHPGAFRMWIDFFFSDNVKIGFEKRVRSYNPTIDTKGAMVGYGLSVYIPSGPPPVGPQPQPSPRGPFEGGPDLFVSYGFHPSEIQDPEGNIHRYLINTSTPYAGTNDGEWELIDLDYPDEYFNLYYYSITLNPDDPARLEVSFPNLLHCEFSWDGTEIVFTGIFDTPIIYLGETPTVLFNDIYIVNADGTFPRRITNDRRVKGRVQLSPDGLDVVYDYRYSLSESSKRRIAILDLTTGLSKDFTDGTFDDYGPAISKDGKTILFTRRDPSTGDTKIMSINRDGTSLSVFALDGREPSFSFDGSRVIYLSHGEDTRLPIITLVDFKSGEVTLGIQTLPTERYRPNPKYLLYGYPSFTPFEEFYLVGGSEPDSYYGQSIVTGTYNPSDLPPIPYSGFRDLHYSPLQVGWLTYQFFSPQQ